MQNTPANAGFFHLWRSIMIRKTRKTIDSQTAFTTYTDRRVAINVKSIFTGQRRFADLIVPAIIAKLKDQKAE